MKKRQSPRHCYKNISLFVLALFFTFSFGLQNFNQSHCENQKGLSQTDWESSLAETLSESFEFEEDTELDCVVLNKITSPKALNSTLIPLVSINHLNSIKFPKLLRAPPKDTSILV